METEDSEVVADLEGGVSGGPLTEGAPESIDRTGTRPGGSEGPPSRGAGGAGQKDPVALEMQDVSCPKEEETQSGRTAASDSVEHPSEPARG